MNAQILFDDYSHWRLRTNHYQRAQYQSRLKLEPARLAAFTRMIAWCGKRQLDPRRWLYTLFDIRNWLFCPPFNHLTPKDPAKGLARYESSSAEPYGHRLALERHQESELAGEIFDPNRDLSPAAEASKRRYVHAGDFERCMSETDLVTFGYHPRSSVCRQCPAAQTCHARLQARVSYNVVALRTGQITAEQARSSVGAHYAGR